MNDEELREARRKAGEARERAEKATPGPWTVDTDVFEEGESIEIVVMGQNPMEMMFTDATTIMPTSLEAHDAAKETQNYRNGEFVAHARTDVPELSALVDALAGEVEEKQQDVENLRKENERLTFIAGGMRAAERREGEPPASRYGGWGGYGGTCGESDDRRGR